MNATAFSAEPEWKLVFEDSGTADWQKQWFLDGKLSEVTNTPEGLVLKTGPIEQKHASTAVLWTQQSFEGDVRVEYDFTRLDSNLDHTLVCLLYLLVTGIGGQFPEDNFKVFHKMP